MPKGKQTRVAKTRKVVSVEQENAQLREQVASQAQASAALVAQLGALAPGLRPAAGQLMVGIRNISDYTIGIVPRQGVIGDVELDLHPAMTGPSPNIVGILPFTQWQSVRKGKLMEQGLIMRDDSVLGNSHSAAPADRPEDIAPGWFVNAILDPEKWVTEHSESEIRDMINKITSEPTLQRLRRVVDVELREIQDRIPKTDPKRARKALQQLPAIYQLIDQVVTMRLELKDEPGDEQEA